VVQVRRGPEIDHPDAVVKASDTVDPPEALDQSDRIPVNVEVDQQVGILKVLAFRYTIRRDQEVDLFILRQAFHARAVLRAGRKIRQDVLVSPLAKRCSGFAAAGELVETYDAFTPDNDPYGERDFGAIYRDAGGRWTTSYPAQGKAVEKVFWKIDAYDRALRFGSEDPANPAVTRRVLSIMLASEY